jgi:hypothetical protein
MTEMKLIESEFSEIDLRSWRIFDAVGDVAKELDRVIAEEITELLQAMFKNYPPRLALVPFEYDERPTTCRKPRANPPLMLRVSLPLGRSLADYGVDYSCSLESVVDELIETVLDDNPETCAEVAARLRELADKLDAACR